MSERQLTYYEMLDVTANASFEEIEASYQRIITYLGPEALAVYSMIEPEEAQKLRSQVDEAFRTLSDPDRRAAYDRLRGGRPVDDGHATSVTTTHAPESATSSTTTSYAASFPVNSTPARRNTGGASSASPAVGVSTSLVVPPAGPEKASTTALVPTKSAPARSVPVPDLRRRRLVPSPDIVLTPDTEFGGALLRRLRESAAASLDDVAEQTKVSKRYLTALEENDFAALPAAVYVRGFVSEYARALGLDSAQVAKSYMALYNRYRGGGG